MKKLSYYFKSNVIVLFLIIAFIISVLSSYFVGYAETDKSGLSEEDESTFTDMLGRFQ